MVGGDRTCMLVVVRYRQAIGDSYEKNKRQAFDLEPCSKNTHSPRVLSRVIWFPIQLTTQISTLSNHFIAMEDIPDIPTDHGTFDGYSSERYYEELMSFMSESSSMRETAKSAVKQSLFSAGGAFAGSFLGGPVGGLIGGVAGSLIGYIKSDDYDGLIIALTKIETERRTVSFFT